MHSSLWVMLSILCAATATQGVARTFTDDQGKTTDAELSAIAGDDVILRRSGVPLRWPLARLSKADQAYVKEWQQNPPATPKLFVRLWERRGFSPAGTFSESKDSQPTLPNIPGIIDVEKKDTFHYFDVDVSNPSGTQASQLSLAYQLYVITASGEIVVEAGARALPSISANQVAKSSTQSISTTRTKTTNLTVKANRQGVVSTGQNRSRESERFGGAWVRVYAHDGRVVGEDRSLRPEIEETDPAWVGPTSAGTSSVENLGEFDAFVVQFQSRLEQLQKFLRSLPPPPGPPDQFPPPPPKSPGS